MDKVTIVNDALRRIGTCCETWALAHQSGTDNEGYEALIRDSRIGYELPPVNFCPWCGDKKGRD